MIRKIKSSIGIKTFLAIAALLMVCCALIYGLILYFMPVTYKVALENQLQENVVSLTQRLETGGVEENSQLLQAFAATHNADILLEAEDGEALYSSRMVYEDDTGTIHSISGIRKKKTDTDSSNIIYEYEDETGVYTVSPASKNNTSTDSLNIIYEYEDETGVYTVSPAYKNETNSSKSATTAVSSFQSGPEKFVLYATSPSEEVVQSYNVLLQLLPLIASIIIAISLISAFVCSRFFSKPLISISRAAKRMAQLDLTWKCDDSRNDEIGVLGRSLNEMALRLDEALNSLQIANNQLQRDIEQERLQEKQRIDFFTAVSHELKTPITIIKGNLEGMIYQVGTYQDRETYLRQSLKTANDMEKLVKETLAAAKMGGNDFQLTAASVNISDSLEKCYRELQGLAEDKEIVMYKNIQPGFYYNGDGRLLKKVFSNIIGNAVTYSPNKATVAVTLKQGVLSVLNTGIHLENEDLKQLFIPFFRVDKSRNSNTGGSGLGLYIVKEILDHHGLSYKIANTSQGVEFMILFP